MAKRKQTLVPWPENVWHTEGRASTLGLVHKIKSHLLRTHQDGQIQHFREFDTRDVRSDSGAWWGFDAGWCTADGARVRARLALSPDPFQAEQMGATYESVSADPAVPLRMVWVVTAEADRPWQMDWPSPVLAFFPAGKGIKWDQDCLLGTLPMHNHTAFATMLPVLGDLLDGLSALSWYTTVITHDRRPLDSEDQRPNLISVLPSGMIGRVLEIRAYGDQDQQFNALLAEHRVQLPWGGAVILPSTPRKDHWASSDYGIKVPGGDLGRLLQKTALHVMKYTASPAHYHDQVRDAVDFMRDCWELPGAELTVSHVREQLEEAQQEVGVLRSKLASAHKLVETLGEDRRKAEEVAEQSRGELLETMKAYREHPLGVRAAEARVQAEEAFSLQEDAMSLAEDLAAEVGWLRRQLAQAPGRSYGEQAPERPKGPKSWRELTDLADSLLSHVRLGDIWGPLEKLAGHKSEDSWIRRTWDALETLEAYAEAKKEHGPDVLPHFRSYLDWPGATALVPKTMYSSSDSSLERGGTDHRVRRTRLFKVEGLGEVFMGAHFRVGGVRPRAPRMHIYDDTSGTTGLIHVGYLGPHLVNANGR